MFQTHRLSFGALDSPDSSICQSRIFPQRLPLVPHQVEVAPQLEVGHVRNVVVDAPERLDGGHGVDLLQVGFVFGEG
jgi:hypothetical protein